MKNGWSPDIASTVFRSISHSQLSPVVFSFNWSRPGMFIKIQMPLPPGCDGRARVPLHSSAPSVTFLTDK